MKSVLIEYFGHACFRISCAGQRIVLDPYADGSVAGYGPLRLDAEFVYCSHGHGDHSAAGNVAVAKRCAPLFGLTELESDHDDAGGTQRGKSIIRIFDFDGVRIAHLGDLGRTLNDAEQKALSGVDCLLLPVGGFFTIDAKTAATVAKQAGARMVIPMHYRTSEAGLPMLGSLEEAVTELENAGLRITVLPFGGSTTIYEGEMTMTIEEVSKGYHTKGYNCAQSVMCALKDETGLDEVTSSKIGTCFGGGMRCGSVCGAVTGGLMAIGCTCLTGIDPDAEKEVGTKLAHELQKRFSAEMGSILCSEILKKHQSKMCPDCIALAAAITKDIIEKNKL